MSVYYSDESVTLHHGDTLEVLRTLADGSIGCCVTSPPYFGLRDYGDEGQYGLESSPAEYVENMRAVFAEVRRVLADDGTLWLNVGDSYAHPGGKTSAQYRPGRDLDGHNFHAGRSDAWGLTRPSSGAPPKNLLGIPWRTAFALQDDGWTLRNAIIWNKPNAMPESVTDRLATKHELIFMFSKSLRYWFDLDPIREPVQRRTGNTYGKVSRRDSFARSTKEAVVPGQSTAQHREDRPDVVAGSPAGRNPGDVWTIPTQPFSEAHFAVFPVEIPRRAIQAGCKPGGTVLDPFSGSGTTGLAAGQLGRRYVGIDLSADYLDLSLRTRLAQTSLLDGGVA